MSVSRIHETASSGTLRSASVISGWLITTAALGAFAFVAGNHVEQQTLGQVVTPAGVVSMTTQPAIAPTLGGVVAHAKVTAAVVNATEGSGPQVGGCGQFRSTQRAGYSPLRERAAQSSNRRGPITLARAGDTSCRTAALASASHPHVGSTPGAAQPGRASFNTPR
jgi:hypothetical protein